MKKLFMELKNLTLKQKLMVELGLTDLIPPKYDTGYMNDLLRL